MSASSKRTPKVAAIMAWNRKLLSPKAQKQVTEHLASSEEARRVAAADRVFESLAADARDEDVPALDWGKVEASLRPHVRTAATQARMGRVLPWGVGFAAAAAVLLVWVSTGTKEDHAQRAPSVAKVATPKVNGTAPALPAAKEVITGEAATALVGRVAAVTGKVLAGVAHTKDMAAVVVGTAIPAGTDLVTAEGASVTVSLYGRTSFELGPQTALRVGPEGPLAPHHVSLVLHHGSVTSHVDKLQGEGAHFDVSALNYRFNVVGTVFQVITDPVTPPWSSILLHVSEGAVEVRVDGRVLDTVRGPMGSWSAMVPRDNQSPHLPMPAPASTTESHPAAGEAPAHSVPFAGPVARPVGTRAVPVLKERDVAREGTLAASAIAPVVAAGTPQLQRCRDTADAQGGIAPVGRFTMRLAIDATGHVEDARLLGPPPSVAFRTCVLSGARSWVFPKPKGGPVTVDVPLLFSTKKP